MGVHFPSFLSFTNYFFHFFNPALHPLISLNWRHRVRIGYTSSTLEYHQLRFTKALYNFIKCTIFSQVVISREKCTKNVTRKIKLVQNCKVQKLQSTGNSLCVFPDWLHYSKCHSFDKMKP